MNRGLEIILARSLVLGISVAVAACPAAPVDKPASPATVKTAPPPAPDSARARRQAIVETHFGQKVADPYRWLEDAKSPETRAWVKAHNARARRHLDALPGRRSLQRRLAQLSYVDWTSAPLRRGERYFFSRRHAKKEKAVYYWRKGEQGQDHVLLDPNTLSKDGSVSVHGVHVAYDGKKVAYKLSRNNADKATLHVMNVATGKVSSVDVIEGAKYASPSWTPSSDGFYYTRLPQDPKIPISELPGHAAVYFHKLGQPPAKDRLVHARTGDPRTFISAELSRDGRYLLLYVQHGWTSTDVYFKDLKGKDRGFTTLVKGVKALFYVMAWKGIFYVGTNEDAPRYRILTVKARRAAKRDAWKVLVPQRKDAVLDSFDVRGGHLTLRYLQGATQRLEIATLGGKKVRAVKLPSLGSVSDLVGNPEDDTAYYSFSSFLTPPTVYRTSVSKGGNAVHFKLELPVDVTPYTTEQVHYPSRDGTRISMFIIRRKDLPRDGSSPFLLTGYGGFNISITPRFSSRRMVWLEYGGALAIPNLRGGGEYGEQWHRDGMLTKKQNVFDDFIAAAEYLIKNKYTSPAKLAISGGSNGGLLVGAAVTQRPELFNVVICRVPLLDMLRYHLFGSGKTWISEYGNPEIKPHFNALHAYSPYHRLVKGTVYPALLMMSADSDDRVDPMHARKFMAAMQHANSGKRPLLFRLETQAGHGGADMIKKSVAATTDAYSFLFQQLGIKNKGHAK